MANEFFAICLAAFLGLPVPQVQVIEVSEEIIENSPELRIKINAHLFRCVPGLHLSSRYLSDPERGATLDYLPESVFKKVGNRLGLCQKF